MPESAPSPQQTLVLLLGASRFPHAAKLAQGRAFYNSAEDFSDYLVSSEGLSIPRENVAWLFDDSRSPSEQLLEIGRFLQARSSELTSQGTPPHDLIVHYVGHGLFAMPDQAYCLAVRGTDEGNEGLSSIRMTDLASVVKSRARFLRKFLILDCCFSAAAYKEFQSGPLTAARVKILNELPERGTTLLCSSSAQNPSLAPQGLSRTMFSDALVKALRAGHPLLGPRISVSELGDLITEELRQSYPKDWVRPEVHSPDRREGDIAGIPIFPNVAYGAGAAVETHPDAPAEAGRATGEAAEARRTAEADEKKLDALVQEAVKRATESTGRQVEAHRQALVEWNEGRTWEVTGVTRLRRNLLLFSPRSIAGWVLRIVAYFFSSLTAIVMFALIVQKEALKADDYKYGSFFILLSLSLWGLSVMQGSARLKREWLEKRARELERGASPMNR